MPDEQQIGYLLDRWKEQLLDAVRQGCVVAFRLEHDGGELLFGYDDEPPFYGPIEGCRLTIEIGRSAMKTIHRALIAGKTERKAT